ncbi:hypothetical protein ATANTOWER_014867 [Ataeniobius toweri]|uniref:Uncharacterized protein n=1 Tax=Ataeniobius toweri TaxID=208326 RepID=A0ABU7CHN7_9TELE|nr:hypothetical protein [Ataeniobius toweri]
MIEQLENTLNHSVTKYIQRWSSFKVNRLSAFRMEARRDSLFCVFWVCSSLRPVHNKYHLKMIVRMFRNQQGSGLP